MKTDPERSGMEDATGIYVRAEKNGKWDSVDIAELDQQSLWGWLFSRESIHWPASTVMVLLGHEVPADATKEAE